MSGLFLSRVNLRGAQLIALKVEKTNLRGSKLMGANLTRAKLFRADLYGSCEKEITDLVLATLECLAKGIP